MWSYRPSCLGIRVIAKLLSTGKPVVPRTRRVLMAEVSGGWVGGRPKLGWKDGVNVILGNRGMMVEAAWQCLKDRIHRKEWEPWYICDWMSFTWQFLLGTVFFQTALLCSGGYHMERGGMLLGYTVNRVVLKIKAQVSSIWAKGCILMTVCVFYLTWHDYPSLV